MRNAGGLGFVHEVRVPARGAAGVAEGGGGVGGLEGGPDYGHAGYAGDLGDLGLGVGGLGWCFFWGSRGGEDEGWAYVDFDFAVPFS